MKENYQQYNTAYPKIFIYALSTFFLFGMIIISVLDFQNITKNFYNYTLFDKIALLLKLGINTLTIIGCIGLFFRKKWAWFIFIFTLCLSLLNLFTGKFNDISSLSLYLSIFFILLILFFFCTKSVTNFYLIQKRTLLIILALILSFAIILPITFFQKRVTEETISSQYLYQINDTIYYKSTKYTGEVIDYFSNGYVKRKGGYTNGIMEGEWVEFYDNKQEKIKCLYKKGMLSGKFESWYSNGKKYTNGFYLNNLKDSIWTEWLNENKYIQENFELGVKNGKASYWDRNGNLIEEGYYLNDKKNGIWKQFNPDKNSFSNITYRNDTLINEYQ